MFPHSPTIVIILILLSIFIVGMPKICFVFSLSFKKINDTLLTGGEGRGRLPCQGTKGRGKEGCSSIQQEEGALPLPFGFRFSPQSPFPVKL